MKRCNYSHWLSFGTYGNETSFSNLTGSGRSLITYRTQTRSSQLFVLIGNTSKSLALRELFGTKARKFRSKRHAGEIHLQLDAASIFHSRPIFIADADSRIVLDGTTDSIYSYFFCFCRRFCFFSADFGGFRQIARRLAVWLEKGQSSALPESTYPRVIIVTDKIPLGAYEEKEARKAFLWMLRDETTHELSKQISDIHVVALSQITESDEVRRNKEDARTLFFATHFAAFFRYVCDYFSQTSNGPFDFIKASRKHNPVAKDLAEHLSIFLKHIKSAKELTEFAVPVIASSILLDNYPPDTHTEDVFRALYKKALYQVNVILRSGFISKVESQLRGFFEQSIRSGGAPSLEIHRSNLRSSTSCLVCLRRRPQYGLPLFGECGVDDPWISESTAVSSAESRCLRRWSSRSISHCRSGGPVHRWRWDTRHLPLTFMKRIEDRIGLPIPLQRFLPVALGISSGCLIVMDIIYVLLKSLRADSLYPAENIEAALQAVCRVGLPVATIREPSSCIFTNYNGVGNRDSDQGYHVIQLEDGYGKVPLWEMQVITHARSASAALDGVGTFQDPGPLENDPLISARSEVAAMFPLAEEPDFMVSLGTGATRANNDKPSMSASGPLSRWKDRAFPRLWRMFWERMRDKHVKQIFRTHPRYHRLDIEFDSALPRLDDTKSIHELQLKAQEDQSITKVIDNIARCAIASLFYFELDSIPEGRNGNHTGTGSIFCSVRQSEPAFKPLLDQLSTATFYLNNCPIPGEVGERSSIGKDGNFLKRVELSLGGRFTISLKQGDSEPCNISGSPYLIEKLISAQTLDAHFGGADHGKRKRSAEGDLAARKRQRI
ncbi:hypothetical protein B0O99DRAFT_719438 [Bisporella sp. PMI_857]|nr:hypothetical protein B0O99DRAFT_719438 [Bisporella sp. PMI_857]